LASENLKILAAAKDSRYENLKILAAAKDSRSEKSQNPCGS